MIFDTIISLYQLFRISIISTIGTILLIIFLSLKIRFVNRIVKIDSNNLYKDDNVNILNDYTRFIKLCVRKSRIYDVYKIMYPDKIMNKDRLRNCILYIVYNKNSKIDSITNSFYSSSMDNMFKYVMKSVNQLVSYYKNIYLMDDGEYNNYNSDNYNSIDYNNINYNYIDYNKTITTTLYDILIRKYQILSLIKNSILNYTSIHDNVIMIKYYDEYDKSDMDRLDIYFESNNLNLSNNTHDEVSNKIVLLHNAYFKCDIGDNSYSLYDIVNSFIDIICGLEYHDVEEIYIHLSNEYTIFAPVFVQLLHDRLYEKTKYVLTNPICYPINYHSNISKIGNNDNFMINLCKSTSLEELYNNIDNIQATTTLINYDKNSIDYSKHKLFSNDTTIIFDDSTELDKENFKSLKAFLKLNTKINF